jgi:histidinol-phosphate aminotransferase
MSDPLRPAIRAMMGYVPGEQPRGDDIIKLNTNENPYPPSPRVFEALRAALTGNILRKYPDPTGKEFRQTAARVLNVDPEGILIGNGSDDILTIVTRAFVPEGGTIVSPTPSYPLYKTLASIQGARFVTVPFAADWTLPRPWPIPDAHLTFIPNPNSPSGTTVSLAALKELPGTLLVDEAYGDFSDVSALPLVRGGDTPVIVSRTFSKSYALAGMRFGFAVADPALIRELVKVKDSYNCDALSQVAATAAISDQNYLAEVRAKILATRARMEHELATLGFAVTPSQANFVWCRASRSVKPIYEALKAQGILVRYMTYEGYGDGLRISVGTDVEIDRLLEALRAILSVPAFGVFTSPG